MSDLQLFASVNFLLLIVLAGFRVIVQQKAGGAATDDFWSDFYLVRVELVDDVSFYNSTTFTWTLATAPRTTRSPGKSIIFIISIYVSWIKVFNVGLCCIVQQKPAVSVIDDVWSDLYLARPVNLFAELSVRSPRRLFIFII